MNGTVAWILSKSKMKSILTGISGYEFLEDKITLRINFNDGTYMDCKFPEPRAIKSIYVDEETNHIMCLMNDGEIIDIAEVPVGDSLDFDWNGTSLGVKRSSEKEYQYVNLKSDFSPDDIEIIDDNVHLTYMGSKVGKGSQLNIEYSNVVSDDGNVITDDEDEGGNVITDDEEENSDVITD